MYVKDNAIAANRFVHAYHKSSVVFKKVYIHVYIYRMVICIPSLTDIALYLCALIQILAGMII